MRQCGSLCWNGHNIEFWLISYVPARLLHNVGFAMVASMGDGTDNWRWDCFDHLLPMQVLLHIAVIRGPVTMRLDDTVGWQASPDLQFSIKSAYSIHCGPSAAANDCLWKAMHRFPGLQRVKVFLWMVGSRRITTNAYRLFRHIATEAKYAVCNADIEDVNHVFRGYASLFVPDVNYLAMDDNTWNDQIFNNSIEECDYVIERGRRLQLLCSAARREAMHSRRSLTINVECSTASLVWLCPKTGCVKLNSDEAEMWGVFLGLWCAWERGYRQMVVELDCIDTIRLIRSNGTRRNTVSSLAHLDELIHRDWLLRFQHVNRKGNWVADFMVKLACDRDFEIHQLTSPPGRVIELLQHDVVVSSDIDSLHEMKRLRKKSVKLLIGSSHMHDSRALSVKCLKSLGDEFIKDQHFTARDFMEAEVVFLKVLNYEIGTSNVAFIFLEELFIRFKGVAKVGELVSFEACMDVMDLLYEMRRHHFCLVLRVLWLLQSWHVTSYVVTVPKQQWEFPVLLWVKFVTSYKEEDIGEKVKDILMHLNPVAKGFYR
ncbi:Cyclin-J18 [Hibiscus syriacus]|uniref:Cyclin-J18 n=1 Tax=Hibiscus syriacus TaxID=106335 RepID=A0A6A3C7S0_HIBSY|nr:Cyclin-J18 [Hibiscus syriacus]